MFGPWQKNFRRVEQATDLPDRHPRPKQRQRVPRRLGRIRLHAGGRHRRPGPDPVRFYLRVGFSLALATAFAIFFFTHEYGGWAWIAMFYGLLLAAFWPAIRMLLRAVSPRKADAARRSDA
ncbi:MAG: hypothetical protein AAGD14_19555 [Planctomycetota bacterium]